MVKAFEDNSIAGVFGRHIAHVNHPKLIQRDLDLHFERMNELPIRKIIDWNEYENNISLRQKLHFFSNNNSGLRRSVWKEIPFPNVDFGEDQTWAKKAIEDGYSLAYEKESIVYHSHHFKFKELNKRNAIELDYFENEFKYSLRYSKKTIIQNLIKKIALDIIWLLKIKELTTSNVCYSFNNNLSRFMTFSEKLKR